MATKILAIIGSGNGSVPDGTQPLPEPVLTSHKWGIVAFTSLTSDQLYLSNEFKNYTIEVVSTSPRGQSYLTVKSKLVIWDALTPILIWWHCSISFDSRMTYSTAWHSPGQLRLSVGQVDFSTIFSSILYNLFYMIYIICFEKCKILWARQVRIYGYVKPWIHMITNLPGLVFLLSPYLRTTTFQSAPVYHLPLYILSNL